MNKLIGGLWFATLMFVSASASSESLAGKGYTVLEPAQPTATSKIEVLEFFSYRCPHCYLLHPHITAWEKKKAKDVELTYVPVPHFQPSWESVARAYYALERMGKIKQLDDEIYKAIYQQKIELYDANSFADFVAKQGVDRATFSSNYAYNTFGGDMVNKDMANAKQMTQRYHVEGTPTLVVEGKYVITGLQPEDAIRVLDSVVSMVRKERAAAGRKTKAAGH